MRKLIFGLSAIFVTWLIAACSASAQVAPPVLVVFETELGAITIEVNAAKAPASAANFLRYVDAGYYTGGRFHRTVRPSTETNKETPIEVVQAGRNRATPETPSFGAIPLERTNLTGLKHEDASVSMARADTPDSARSDFFICIGAQPELDFGGKRNPDGQGFAVFGRVVSGMDVVKKIQASAVREGTQTLAPPIAITRAVRK